MQAATTPSQMATVTTSIDSSTGGVTISWVAPHDGGSTIDAYRIEIANAGATSWTADTTNCDGASSTIMSQMYCVIPMSTLTAAPYSYAFDQLVVVRASAHNTYGYSTASSSNTIGAKIRSVPNAMAIPAVVSYSDTAISISWTALTAAATGNSAITAYNLQWDSGSGSTFTDLTSQTATTYSVTGLTGGTTYQFQVRARNVYGYGSYSSVLTVSAIDFPAKMAIPTVTLSTTDVVVSWTAPDAHSSAITLYEVLFLKADGTFGTETTNCDGSNAGIVAARTCTIPMATIKTLTSKAVDTLI
jgi:hypothetical protein